MEELQKEYDFKLHIINAEYGIASARLCDMPESYVTRRVMDSKNLLDTLFCYLKERDMIVLNEDNMLSPAFGELIIELFQLTDEELSKELMRLNEVSTDYLNGPIIRLLGIQEYRRLMGYTTGSMNN